jgi:environmental stress-induced protein Ves
MEKRRRHHPPDPDLPPGATLDDFDYRISMASVASDGPFSYFAGVDRQLLLLDGNGLLLQRGDGSHSQLDKHSSALAFAGEEPINSQLQDGPVLDFNVMTRRGRYRQQVESLNCTACAACKAVTKYCW